MSRDRLVIFIGSTMVELHNERVVVKKVLEERGFEVFVFEYDAGARPESVMRTSLGEVEAADLYIGIFWNRYGQVTVEEYRHARRLNKPCLVYIKNYDVNREPDLTAFLTEEVMNVEDGVSYWYFKDVVELSEAVGRDVQDWLTRQLRQAQEDLNQARRKLQALTQEKEAAESERLALERRIAALQAEVEMLKRARTKQLSDAERLFADARNWFERLGYRIINTRRVDSHRYDLLIGFEDAYQRTGNELIVCTDRSIGSEEVNEILRNCREGNYTHATIVAYQHSLHDDFVRADVEGVEALSWEDFLSDRLSRLKKADTTTLWELIELGRQAFNQGDFSRAICWFEMAATQARLQSNLDVELQALSWLSVAWGNVGDLHKMLESATRLLAHAREVQNKTYEMVAVLRLANALAEIDLRGRWRELRPLLLEGLETARLLKDEFYEIYYLILLGDYAIQAGEAESGFQWLQQALWTVHPSTENRNYFRYRAYQSLSNLMRQHGNYSESIRYAEMALSAAREDGNPGFVASAQLTLARAERARGELAEALRLVEEVLPKALQMGWKGSEQTAQYLRGELLREMGHPEEAEPAARRALALAREMKLKGEEVECLLSLGQVLRALGRRSEARGVLAEARRLSQERDYADHFQRAEELLRGG